MSPAITELVDSTLIEADSEIRLTIGRSIRQIIVNNIGLMAREEPKEYG